MGIITMKYLFGLLYLIFSVCGVVLVKKSGGITFSFAKGFFDFHISIFFFLGTMSYVFSFLLLINLLPRFNLNYFVPITVGIAQIAVLAASYFILNEPVTWRNIIGVILIISGIAFVANS